MTALDAVFRDVERGVFPACDGGLTVLPAPAPHAAAVVSFTGHVFVAADVDEGWVRRLLPPGELSEAFTPPFLGALAAKTGLRVNALDMLALAPPSRAAAGVPLVAVESDHPRVRRARRYRTDVRAWSTPGAVVTLGRGLGGRWEIGIEVDEAYRGRGLGRAVAAAARGLVPDGRPLWAQIAAGNAASVRAFLAAGYAPVGMEALLVAHSGERG